MAVVSIKHHHNNQRHSIDAEKAKPFEKLNFIESSRSLQVEHMPIDFQEKFDPFKKTGIIFGSLYREIKHRYSKYLSDITDALNWNCLISLLFIFTLCIAPALCFGAILGNFWDLYFYIIQGEKHKNCRKMMGFKKLEFILFQLTKLLSRLVSTKCCWPLR